MTKPKNSKKEVPWGPVKVIGGPYKGRFGYYDDDNDNGLAIVYLPPGDPILTYDSIRHLGWMLDYFDYGMCISVPVKDLDTFEEGEEEIIAYARLAPVELAHEHKRLVDIVSKFSDCLRRWGFSAENIDKDIEKLDRILSASKVLSFPLKEDIEGGEE